MVRAPDGSHHDIEVDATPEATIEEVARALARHLGLEATTGMSLRRSGGWMDASERFSSSGLLHGDEILLGSAPTDPSADAQDDLTPTADLELVVAGGTNIGARWPLESGTLRVGRGRECEIQIDDPALSRTHLSLEVSTGAIWVSDAGSTNGTFLNGVRLEDRHRWSRDEVIEAGGSLFALSSTDAARPATVHPAPGGRLLFNRPPRVASPPPQVSFELPAAPSQGARPRLPLASAAIPLLIALVLWRMFPDNPSLLLIMALSPVMVVASYVEERRRGGRGARRSEAEWRDALDTTIAEVSDARSAYAERERRHAPGAAELQRRASERAADLWERRPPDPDFLTVRCGWGDRPWPVELRRASHATTPLDRDADARLEPLEVLPSVPLTIDTASAGVVGLAGDLPSVEAAARWIALQLVTLHSPEELSLVALLEPEAAESWEWMSWLPHVERGRIATTSDEASALAEELVGVVEQRSAARSPGVAPPTRPHRSVVAFIDHRARPSRTMLTRLLREGPAAGVFIIWMGSKREDLPGETGAIVELPGTEDVVITFAGSGAQLRGAREGVTLDACRATALALAPLIDAAPRDRSRELPSEVSLFSVLGLDLPTPQRVAEVWRERSRTLAVPIGVGDKGTIELDLGRDGPHALVAGTTGAGKSELLQTLVASLAWHHGPERVNLLLIDYKGGAAFKDCATLPHTVGLVTDLDAQLSHRALVSLDAELKRRERHLRDAGARDVTELESLGTVAMPRLILIIDEFAALVKELPAFVDGVIDLAQRGRSLGIHLVLATQRPAGVINDAIRANTNLRIALRVADEPDSTDVVGTTDAAHISRAVPGRALIRRGHGEVEEFQSAFSGGPAATSRDGIVVRDRTAGVRGASASGATIGLTQLAALVAAVDQAAEAEGVAPARSPWLPPLPALLSLEALSAAEGSAPGAFGLVDKPEQQRQLVATFDPHSSGGLVVYGAAGAGKTTLLRTAATSLATRESSTDLHLYALDFGSSELQSLRSLPHCGDVIGGDEHERVERLFAVLRDEIERRKRDAAARIMASAPARWLVLLDGYEGFNAAFERVDMGELVDLLPRLVADGRAVGVHFAVTAERRAAIPSALASLFATRVVLRMADEDEYLALGLNARDIKGSSLPPGRGFLDGAPLQVAVIGDDPTADAQAAAVSATAEGLTRPDTDRAPRPVTLLPTLVTLGSLAGVERALTACIGVTESDLSPGVVDLSLGHLLIAGPYRSGRSTALLTAAHSLRASTPRAALWLLTASDSPIGEASIWDRVAIGVAQCEEALAAAGDDAGDPLLLFVDDADDLAEGPSSLALESLVRERGGRTRVIAAAESMALHRSFGGWLSELRKHKQGVLLDPDLDLDGDLLGVKLPRKQKRAFPPGRAYLVNRGRIELIQIARP